MAISTTGSLRAAAGICRLLSTGDRAWRRLCPYLLEFDPWEQ